MRRSLARKGRWFPAITAIVAAAAAAPTGPAGAAAPPTLPPGYVPLVDDTGAITVAVPPTWTDIDTAPAADDAGRPLPYIAAAPDIESFINTFSTPGVRYLAFAFEPSAQVLIDGYGLTAGCQSITVQPYDDGVFTGSVQVGTGCGDGQATWNMVVASPPDQSFTALVQVQTATPADQQALDTVLASFNVAGSSAPAPTVVAPTPTLAPTSTVVLPTLVAPAPTAPTGLVPTVPSGESITLEDDTGRLTVQVPSSWAQADTAVGDAGNARISASTDLATFLSEDEVLSYSVPGLHLLEVTHQADTASYIRPLAAGFGSGCTLSEVTPYDDNVFAGSMVMATECGGTGTFRAIIVANPPSNLSTITLVVQLQSVDDPALELILGSFDLIGV